MRSETTDAHEQINAAKLYTKGMPEDLVGSSQNRYAEPLLMLND